MKRTDERQQGTTKDITPRTARQALAREMSRLGLPAHRLVSEQGEVCPVITVRGWRADGEGRRDELERFAEDQGFRLRFETRDDPRNLVSILLEADDEDEALQAIVLEVVNELYVLDTMNSAVPIDEFEYDDDIWGLVSDFDPNSMVTVVTVLGFDPGVSAAKELADRMSDILGKSVSPMSTLVDDFIDLLDNELTPETLGCDRLDIIESNGEVLVVLTNPYDLDDFGGISGDDDWESDVDDELAAVGRGSRAMSGVFDGVAVPLSARREINEMLDQIISRRRRQPSSLSMKNKEHEEKLP